MNLSYNEDYWDLPELKSEFINFLVLIHGLDLSLWDEMGFWDKQYRPFSYFSDSTLISNVCVYSMEMVIQGKQCRVAQISGVGTLPKYRRKGLSLKLTQKAMDWARVNHDFFFLFADKNAYHFYDKCGFQLTDEHKASISVLGKVAHPGSVKLDIQRRDHLEMIYRFASNRIPVSDTLGVSNKKLFMFLCLYFLRDNIYHIPDLDILVLHKRENGLVTIFDIVGTQIPSFSKIYSYICDESDETVEFLFMVDKLNLESIDLLRVDDNGTHVLGNFSLKTSQFIFPFTAHA